MNPFEKFILLGGFVLCLGACEKGPAEQQSSIQSANPQPQAPPKPVPEQASVDRFAAQIAEVRAWRTQRTAELKNDLLLKPLGLIELIPKLKAIDSTGLPVDLKIAWRQTMSKVARLEPIIKNMGGDPAGMFEKSLSNPYAIQELKKELNVVLADISASERTLITVGNKYGIDKIGEVIPN